MQKNIYIFGDSHTDAIKKALKSAADLDFNKLNLEAYRYSKIKNEKEIGDISEENILQIVSSLKPEDLVVSTIGGNQHQIVSLIQHPSPFDFYSREASPLPIDLGKTIIPFNQFFDYFFNGIVNGKDGKRLLNLKNHAPCKVVHLVPPPPKKDTDHIIKFHESHFEKNSLAEKGVSAPELRLKMWKLQVDILKKFAHDYGFELLSPPEEAVDPDGFLSYAFYANDATHANPLYGQLVLKQLEIFLLNPAL